jgi:hypothetical protein
MYKLAETFIKKESQWQAAAAPLGWTGAALGAGLGATAFGVSQFLKNPSNVKTLTDIPGNTWNGIKNFSNNIGNYVAPKKSTINSAPKPINWTNTAPSDVTSVNMYKGDKKSTPAADNNISTSNGAQATTDPSNNTQPQNDGNKPSKWGRFRQFTKDHPNLTTRPLKLFGTGVGLSVGASLGNLGLDYIASKNKQSKLQENMRNNTNLKKWLEQDANNKNTIHDSINSLNHQLDSLKSLQR